MKFLFFFILSFPLFAQTSDFEFMHPQFHKLSIIWNEDGISKILLTNKAGKVFQELDGQGDWTNLGSVVDRSRKDIVKMLDVNFDSHSDLLIEQASGSAGQTFKLFMYDLKTKKFTRSDALDEIWNITVDNKSKTILSYPNDGKKEIFYWKKDKLIKKP